MLTLNVEEQETREAIGQLPAMQAEYLGLEAIGGHLQEEILLGLGREAVESPRDKLMAGLPEDPLIVIRSKLLKGDGDILMASDDEKFRARFGRDTLIGINFMLESAALEDNEALKAELEGMSKRLLLGLASDQGDRTLTPDDPEFYTAKRKGEIAHETRHKNGEAQNDNLINTLWQEWTEHLPPEKRGKPPESLVVYYSLDATPLFVSAVYQYVAITGDTNILHEQVPGREAVTMAESVLMALEAIDTRREESSLGLLEYYRAPGQELAIKNQVFADSITSYVHENGEMANTKAPIAPVEVQGMAYDAYLDAADMFESQPELVARFGIHVDKWRSAATQQRETLFSKFWNENKRRFAQALDRNPATGEVQQITTASVQQFMLLNTRLFDDLPDAERQHYIQPMVNSIISEEFMTAPGLRCRAVSNRDLVDFADYHGSWASWPWLTHWVANGLRHQGFDKAAPQLDIRALNAAKISQGYLEYYFIDPTSDEVYYMYDAEQTPQQSLREVVATNAPEEPQAWTVAALLDILQQLEHPAPAGRQDSWTKDFQEQLILNMRQYVQFVAVLSPEEAQWLRQKSTIALINTAAGKTAEKVYYEKADEAVWKL